MIEKIKELFSERNNKAPEFGKIIPISLANYLNVEEKPKYNLLRLLLPKNLFSLYTFGFLLIGSAVIYTAYKKLSLIGLIFVVAVGIILHVMRKKISAKKMALPKYTSCLLSFIYDNQLYEEDNQGSIVGEIEMAYAIYPNEFCIYVGKNGDKYQKYATTLGELLESRLGMQLYEFKENNVSCEYVFKFEKADRKRIIVMPKEDTDLSISIYDDFKLNLKENYSFLISGASGAGKSYLTYYMLTSFISKTVNGDHAILYAIDPKQADLKKICKVSGMPAENYGSSVAEAFQIVRTYLKELDRRMELYENSSDFNAVGVDLGMVPALLVIEEYSSLVAEMSSKQKTEFENLVSIVAQKGRSLSMALWVVMQQPRADSLGSNIKEQLLAGGAVFLGNPTNVAAQMMFDSTEVPKVSGKGVGMYSKERSQPKVFESPVFESSVFETILPVWEHVAKSYKKDEPIEEVAESWDYNDFL